MTRIEQISDSVTLHVGDCLEVLRTLTSRSVQCCVTSPPYFGLRDYGCDGQIGLESTPEEYVSRLVEVFKEVRRVLHDDGTLWLNLGDSYAGSGKGGNPEQGKQATNKGSQTVGVLYGTGKTAREAAVTNVTRKTFDGIKAKDLIGIPWRVAFALQSDGWHLRQDIIWHKPNPMPESVQDRCTKAHEYVFLLSKSARYYFDHEAIKEPAALVGGGSCFGKQSHDAESALAQSRQYDRPQYTHRNKRSVWSITTKPYSGTHFATMPPDLVEPCIMAGSRAGDTILDPFNGSGTTGAVAVQNDRKYVGIELNGDYIELAKDRIGKAISAAKLNQTRPPLPFPEPSKKPKPKTQELFESTDSGAA